MASDVSPAKHPISVTRTVDARASRFSELQDMTSHENSLNGSNQRTVRDSNVLQNRCFKRSFQGTIKSRQTNGKDFNILVVTLVITMFCY